jgi:uncharacterized protein YndB with AHSA1/START domain/ribosomal protein S18 acetylase RimI-like enzyme
MDIARAHEEPRLTMVRELMVEYLAWVIARTRAAGLDPETLKAHYYEGGAETLPGAFVPPDGCLLFATEAAEPAGLVAYDRVDATACEMKRMYVRPAFRGRKVARALAERLLAEAHAAGYRTMRLETRAFMPEAIALYAALGFRECAAFHAVPESFRTATRFMEFDLGGPAMTDDRTLETSRLIDAPPARVFDAIRDPAQLTRWWGPAGFTSTFDAFEFRPGGHWRFVLHAPDGKDYPNHNQFGDIVANERVVVRHVEGHYFELTITLADEGGKTRVSWRMEFPSAEELAGIAEYVRPANEQNLDRLMAVVTA